MTASYTVIGSPKTRAFRVMWMLDELGQAYTVNPLPPRDASLSAFNPSLKIPVLMDGDAAIIDSVAICQYLADKHNKMTFAAGTIDRAHQDSFTQFTVDEVEGALWMASKHTFALPTELRVPDVKRACEFEFNRAIRTLEERLGSNAYVMGETFTVPDLLLGHCGGWASRLAWTIPDGPVADYMARVRARAAFAAATARSKHDRV